MLYRSAEVGQGLERLGLWLQEQAPLWQPLPFKQHRLSWEDHWPALSAWLRGLSMEQVTGLERAPLEAQGAPAMFGELARQSERLTRVAALEPGLLPALARRRRLAWRVPRRKWTQVTALARVLEGAQALPQGGRVVDWCAGKGHLGRTLAALGQSQALLLERNGELAPQAHGLAQRAGVQVQFEAVDVLQPSAEAWVQGADALVALHACGALGQRALRLGAQHRLPTVALASCCYHMQLGQPFVPMSALGRGQGLPWEPRTLRLAVADDVVARRGDRLMRIREMAFRQGLDLLLRQRSGEDRYTALPPLPVEWLREPFARFCELVAARHQLTLPARWDPAQAEEAGWERARHARALGLVRSLFRRPLELWLVLDRAQFLVEQGRPVLLGCFCPQQETPRNLLLLSRLEGSEAM